MGLDFGLTLKKKKDSNEELDFDFYRRKDWYVRDLIMDKVEDDKLNENGYYYVTIAAIQEIIEKFENIYENPSILTDDGHSLDILFFWDKDFSNEDHIKEYAAWTLSDLWALVNKYNEEEYKYIAVTDSY